MSSTWVWRVLDVNANRAAEGLRTIEEVARLVCEDAVCSQWTKSLRHELGEAVARLDRTERLNARSTETDAGTGCETDTEVLRTDWRGLIHAACERVGQSLRCLEEFSKLIDIEVATQFKALRYQAYDQLARIELRLCQPHSLQISRLCVLVDCLLPIAEFKVSMKKLSQSGADLIQLRDKQADGGKLCEYARAAIEAVDSSRTQIVVNDRVDVALASGAAGVHLGQTDMSLPDARRIVGQRMWIGISTHSIEQALEAEAAGADYIGCGPTFPSATKSFDHFPGINFLREVSQRICIPAFAIGGIQHDNVDQVLSSGCSRIAVSAAVHAANDPVNALFELKHKLLEHSVHVCDPE